MKKAGVKELALAAKVSTATVDRVLNERGGVSQEKERLVLEWARKLKMDRNLQHRALRTLRVGVIMQRPSNLFYRALGQAFSRGERQFHDANIMISQHYFDVDALAETEQLVRRLGRQQDALIVVLQDHPALTAALREASQHIPVVTLASDMPGSGRLGYVGMDNRAAGRVAGDLMGRLVGRAGGDIVVVSGLQEFIGQGERQLGFQAVLAERHRQCRLLAVLEPREQNDQAERLVRDVLARHRSVVGIYNFSSCDLGIARAIRAARGHGPITFITHELTPERRRLLVEGVVDIVIDQNPALEASMAMEMIAAHFGRIEEQRTRFLTPVQIYTWENCFGDALEGPDP